MKTFSFLVLFACVAFVSARADIPAPKPNVITVNNLAAFPKYKFSYRTDAKKESKPISEGQSFTVHNTIQLLIQSGSSPAQQWEQIRYEWKGAKVTIKVEDVKEENGRISVTYKTSGVDSAPGKKSASKGMQSLPLFALTGVGVCGLILLGRRRNAR